MRSLWVLLLLAVWSRPVRAQAIVSCVVSRIVDGDTFWCRGGVKVRPIGFDAPERGQGVIHDSATARLARWLPLGDTVRLERDVSRTDRYGRQFAWVWRGDTLVNERMVASGWAVLYTVPPDVRYVERLERAERRARMAKAGLWGGRNRLCIPSAYRKGECK